jgi:hypothetical protein
MHIEVVYEIQMVTVTVQRGMVTVMVTVVYF